MISYLLSLVLKGSSYIKEHPQILFVLMLLIVLPLLFLYTGQQFLSVGKSNQDRLQKDKIGIMHDTLASLLSATHFDVSVIEKELRHIKDQNPDIIEYKIAKKVKDTIVPIVAFNVAEVGTPLKDSDLYINASLRKDESIIFEFSENGGRVWSTYRYVPSETGDDYFIFTKVSLKNIDALFKAREHDAYAGLIFVYFFVIALAYWHIKLTDYRFLYLKASKAIETRDLFTNMIAHELRAPLTAIRGYANILELNSVNAVQKEQANRIEQSSNRLLIIINDLLDVARLQSGSLQIVIAEVAVCACIDTVVAELSIVAEEKSIALSTDYRATKAVINADTKRFHQAMSNLVSNAIKYTKEGTITLSVEDTHANVEIRVKDTGMGISSTDQKKLFAPFFRVTHADMSTITGTGLGMWITKELIERMGGTIGVESIRDVGTHVVITFPKELKIN